MYSLAWLYLYLGMLRRGDGMFAVESRKGQICGLRCVGLWVFDSR
jgi:hypothetical protein